MMNLQSIKCKPFIRFILQLTAVLAHPLILGSGILSINQ